MTAMGANADYSNMSSDWLRAELLRRDEERRRLAEIERRRCLQPWLDTLSMQQQSVLILALRGPDGLPKDHPAKVILRRYRACILKSAYLGRPLRHDEEVDSFHSLAHWTDDIHWRTIEKQFFRGVDELPLHFFQHLLHGCEILGYKYPDLSTRVRWNTLYINGTIGVLHTNPETEEQMDTRLGDWQERFWDGGAYEQEAEALLKEYSVPRRAPGYEKEHTQGQFNDLQHGAHHDGG